MVLDDVGGCQMMVECVEEWCMMEGLDGLERVGVYKVRADVSRKVL